jgi:lipopolysaccharide transport system ATP-binding protein
LKLAAPDRFIEPQPFPDRPLSGPAVPGAVYSPIYSNQAELSAAVPDYASHRIFVVIRDPRDTLVSWYFSLMYSHKTDKPTVAESRTELQQLSKADGLALIIGKQMLGVDLFQRQWLATGVPIFRYEDMWADQHGQFARIFDFCKLNVSPLRRRYLVHRQSFTLRTFWRLGRPNPKSHFRQGAPGDWKNHFNDDVKRLFKDRFGEILVRAGYEKDERW